MLVEENETFGIKFKLKELVYGDLTVTSVPETAEVFIDGMPRGFTPLTISNETASNHKIRVSKAGFFDKEEYVVIKKNKTTSINYLLEVEVYGGLEIISYPTNAFITIDDNNYGVTPQKLERLRPGMHAINISKAGYKDAFRATLIKAQKNNKLEITLKKL